MIRQNSTPYSYRYMLAGIFGILLMLCCLITSAQRRWTGNGFDGKWNTAANWEGGILPVTSDVVILDNTFVSENYIVQLPGGDSTIRISRLEVMPSAGSTIQLILPAENTANPGLLVESPELAVNIGAGGVLINQSGAGSGSPLVLEGTLRIGDGGKYIHRTRRSHAALVAQLVHDSATARGIFEFDVPAASSTISVSDRSYGTLIINAAAAGGAAVYTAAGTRKIRVLGDLVLQQGTQVKMNCSDTLHIGGNLIQYKGLLDLGTTARTLALEIRKDIIQSDSAVITATGTGAPVILLSGKEEQQVEMNGSLENQVRFRVQNEYGVKLVAPLLLPYRLELNNGKLITSAEHPVILAPEAWIIADTLLRLSFINGPVIKEGLKKEDRFLFPVGARNVMRWVAVQDFSGSMEMEFFADNPRLLADAGPGLNRISAYGYWRTRLLNEHSDSIRLTLSFNDGNSSGVTDMQSLAVAVLSDTVWENGGNAATTGSPGAAGTVSSHVLKASSLKPMLFTLAGTLASENPLPLYVKNFRYRLHNNAWSFSWETMEPIASGHFILYYSSADSFVEWIRMPVHSGTNYSTHLLRLPDAKKYSVQLGWKDGEHTQLFEVLQLFNHEQTQHARIDHTRYLPGTGLLYADVHVPENCRMEFFISDISGRIQKPFSRFLYKGNNRVEFSISGLPSSMYHIFGLSSMFRTSPRRFLKL